MQQYVQKSSTTTLPRRSLRRRGPAVFSQPTPPSSSGARSRSFSSFSFFGVVSSGLASGGAAGLAAAAAGWASGHWPQAYSASPASRGRPTISAGTRNETGNGRDGSGREGAWDISTLLLGSGAPATKRDGGPGRRVRPARHAGWNVSAILAVEAEYVKP